MQTYEPPVSRLLNYAVCSGVAADQWPDYVSDFGFTKEHIPNLLALMQEEFLINLDPEEDGAKLEAEGIDPDLAVYAPIHAWRVLGQLQAVEFLDAAVTVLKTDELDWAWDEFPDVITLIGPTILEPLVAVIAAEASEDDGASTLIEGLWRLAETSTSPEARDRFVAAMTDLLKRYEQNHPANNGGLVTGLLKLKAVESVEVIEAAYAAKKVDEFFNGTWPAVQVELGLKTEEDFTEEELTPEMPPYLKEMRASLERLERMRKPTAFSMGLPIDPSLIPSTKPPEFDDMLMVARTTESYSAQKGFGSAQKSTVQKSTKKSKKKKR